MILRIMSGRVRTVLSFELMIRCSGLRAEVGCRALKCEMFIRVVRLPCFLTFILVV